MGNANNANTKRHKQDKNSRIINNEEHQEKPIVVNAKSKWAKEEWIKLTISKQKQKTAEMRTETKSTNYYNVLQDSDNESEEGEE